MRDQGDQGDLIFGTSLKLDWREDNGGRCTDTRALISGPTPIFTYWLIG